MKKFTHLTRGDHVVDREKGDDRLVVVEVRDQRAYEFELPTRDGTLADLNPPYPETDRVVETTIFATARAQYGVTTGGAAARAADRGLLDTTVYPQSRLEVVPEVGRR